MLIVGVHAGSVVAVVSLTTEGKIRSRGLMSRGAEGLHNHFSALAFDYPDMFVCVQKPSISSRRGGVGTLNYGIHYGELLGVLTALDIPHQLIHAKRWLVPTLRGLEGPRSKVAKTYLAAKSKFPSESFLANPRCTKPHPGLVNATLIAEYARLRLKTGAYN